MIKEEYKKLLEMIEMSEDPTKISLEEILKEAVVFFEALRKEFPKAPKEEREEMIQMMTHLHSRLQEVSTKAAEASGMSEDDLTAYAENPSNFTPEQWQAVQETRRNLYDSARKFSSALEKEKEGEAPQGEIPKKKTVRPRTRRSRRKDWLGS